MTVFSDRTMKRLEMLAGIQLTDEERESLKGDLNGILAHFSVLQRLDVDGLLPSGPPPKEPGAWREDALVPSLTQEGSFESASRVREEFFAVPLLRGYELEENW